LRTDGRQANELRPVNIEPDYSIYADGSVLISIGNTRVLCNLSIEDGVPKWMQAQGKPGGWLTAEYSMLPRSTLHRTPRETTPGGRTMEIRRLIGRSLRASIDLLRTGPMTFTLDCDVLQADGGTRTAAITGGYIALALGVNKLISSGRLPEDLKIDPVAAVSVGIVGGKVILDLTYEEDVVAEVDANFVMNSRYEFIEIQGTAERESFSKATLLQMVDLAAKGIDDLFSYQKQSQLTRKSMISLEGKYAGNES
jgi:ribonuclease PH